MHAYMIQTCFHLSQSVSSASPFVENVLRLQSNRMMDGVQKCFSNRYYAMTRIVLNETANAVDN